MKLGADNPKLTIGAVALFVFALLLFFRMVPGGGSQAPAPRSSATAGPTVPAIPAKSITGASRPRGSRAPHRAASEDNGMAASLDPRLKLDLLRRAEETSYSGSGRNIFRAQAEPVIPQPVAPALRPPDQAAATPSGPPTPPPPPPINLKFFGFATSTGGPKRVFLSQGEDIFVAAEGDIVNRRYKIIRIGETSIEVEDLLSNRRQNLPLTS